MSDRPTPETAPLMHAAANESMEAVFRRGCELERQRDAYAENAEKAKERHARYYVENKDKVKEYQSRYRPRYYAKNKNKERERQRDAYAYTLRVILQSAGQHVSDAIRHTHPELAGNTPALPPKVGSGESSKS